ncbi:MAG: bifunctional diguanylate cyclase/phosphodiesterase [Geminicoccaceae bacterium]
MVGLSIQRHDAIAETQSIGFVKDSIAQEVGQVRQIVKDYSWWTDAFTNLTAELDEDWAHTNIGLYLYDLHGINLSFVVGPDDQTLYGQIDGKRIQESAHALFSTGLKNLIDTARSTPDQGAPIPADGILSIGNDIALVGVSAVKPESGNIRPQPSGWATVLISAKILSPELLGTIEARLPIKGLKIVRGESSGRWSLTEPTGNYIAGLDWQAGKPGSEFVRSIWPLAAGVVALIVVFTIVVLWYVRYATAKIEVSEVRFRDVADASSDWIWETDGDLRVTYLSANVMENSDRIIETWRNQPIGRLFKPIAISKQWQWIEDDARQRASFRNLLCICTIEPHGAERTLRLTGKPFHDRKGRFEGYRGTATDITREITAQRNAEYLATHDSLSGLANRDVLHKRLTDAVVAIDQRRASIAVICLDLDRFKDVNDTLGHAAGDALLVQLAGRLRQCVTKRDMIARISGDEFAIVQPRRKQPEPADQLCSRLLAEIRKPFLIDGQDVFTTASFGIALIPADGTTAKNVLQKADIALYEAKRQGGNTFRRYDSGMDRRRRERRSIETDLRMACKHGQFELYYQPVIRTNSQSVIGAEALIRWHHPKRGLIEPWRFIEIAEESGLILPLSEWVIGAACRQGALWPDIRLAVNLSPLQFRHKHVARMLRRALDDSGMAADRLEVEITEGVMLKGTEMSTGNIKELKDLGVHLTIDDFGTGYSNLSYMQQFNFDKLKIDRSFLSNGSGRPNNLIRAIINLGHSLGMQVCAEGVEKENQLAFLRRERCDQAQGFHIGRPIPANEFAQRFGHDEMNLCKSPKAEKTRPRTSIETSSPVHDRRPHDSMRQIEVQ